MRHGIAPKQRCTCLLSAVAVMLWAVCAGTLQPASAAPEALAALLPGLRTPALPVEDKARTAVTEAVRRAEEAKAREEARDKARQAAEASAERLEREAESARREAQSASEDTVWQAAFRQNLAQLDALEIRVDGLSAGLVPAVRALQEGLPGIEEAALRLFALASTHENNPLMLESLDRRGALLASALSSLTEPVRTVRAAAAELEKSVSRIRHGLPYEMAAQSPETAHATGEPPLTPEQAETVRKAGVVRDKLNAVEQRAAQALEPAETLRASLEKMHVDIAAHLPGLWKQRYLTPPTRFFDPAVLQRLSDNWETTLQNLQLRLSVELPRGAAGWSGTLLRFFNVLAAGWIALFFLHRRLTGNATWTALPAPARGRLERGVLWCLCGLALGSAAFGTQGEQHRLIYTLGSLWLIWGEMLIAWSLRCLSLRDEISLMPLRPLFAASASGIALAYPGLPQAVLAVLWVVVCLVILWSTGRGKSTAPALEVNLMHAFRISLWLGLVSAAVGWQQPGILLVVATSCICVSIQLVTGLLHYLNRSSSVEDSRKVEQSVLAGLLAACIAPLVLVLVVAAMFVWVVALPGGAVLLTHYMEVGVQVGSATFNMVHLFLILSAFYLTRAAVFAARAFLDRLALRPSRLDKSLLSPLQTGITYGLWTLFGLFTLRALGFSLENLAVIAGGLSVGIGFGMQNIVNNFMSGLILIFSRTLHEGDVVDVGTLQGTVRKISIRATTIETFDNAVIFVPNSQFVSNSLINWTRNGYNVRSQVQVGVAYGTDPGRVEALLLDIARRNEKIFRYPEPHVLFSNFGASTLDFTLRFWTDFSIAVSVCSTVRHEIARVFAEQGVDIAFPQLDVHLTGVSATPEQAAGVPAEPPAPRAPA